LTTTTATTKESQPPETRKETVANKDDDDYDGNGDNDNNDDDDNNDKGDNDDNMQTASKGTQTEVGAWIIPGRQSQTLLEDFASAMCPTRAFPAMQTTRQTNRRGADQFPSLPPDLQLLPDTVAAPPDLLLPLRGLQMSADVGRGNGDRSCQCRQHCHS
jgi:hypothetical protein